MAVRVRRDGTIICAAESDAEEGDCYINDPTQYRLHVEMKVLCYKGGNLWEFDNAENGERRYEEEFDIIRKERRNG